MSWTHAIDLMDESAIWLTAGCGIVVNFGYRNLYRDIHGAYHPDHHARPSHDLYSPFEQGRISRPEWLREIVAQGYRWRKKRSWILRLFRAKNLVLVLATNLDPGVGHVYRDIKRHLGLRRLGVVDRAFAVAARFGLPPEMPCIAIHYDDDHSMISALDKGNIVERLVLDGGANELCRRLGDWLEREMSVELGPCHLCVVIERAFPEDEAEREPMIKVAGKNTSTGLPAKTMVDANTLRQVLIEARDPERATMLDFIRRRVNQPPVVVSSAGTHTAAAHERAMDIGSGGLTDDKWVVTETAVSAFGAFRIINDLPEYEQVIVRY